MNPGQPRIVTLEEHYTDPEILGHYGLGEGLVAERLADVATARCAEMNKAGIALQVLSHAPPGLQAIEAQAAPALARRANDRLHRIIVDNPTRFAGFASLPTATPQAAADELERSVTELGLKGGMIHGPTNGLFLDEQQFWPIFARAEALGAPLYLHPADPLPVIANTYFGDYAKTHPMFLRAAWGFTMETGTHAMRLVLSGLFDAYPNLQLILGHFGETIPFLLTRIDEALGRDTPMKDFRAQFTNHFHVTTSGFFSDAALLCCVQEIGIDRIMRAVGRMFRRAEAREENAISDHVFALAHLLGFRFAPRIPNLADRKLCAFGPASTWPALAPLIAGRPDDKLIAAQWDNVFRMAASVRTGAASASLMLKRLGA